MYATPASPAEANRRPGRHRWIPAKVSAVPEGLEIKEGRHGRGVHTTRSFARGDSVESCPTLELPGDQVVGQLGDYVFGSGEDENEVLLLLGYGMLYNHSFQANLEYIQEGPRVIAFVTLRDIEPGEELTINYGEEWWSTRNLEPD
jgi:hypothetical protein